tara:strand:- start:41 stop:304 length:264 start_codon:yes stop_codon:yes gene_type:complete
MADINSWKLANDKGVPHAVVVNKLKKYRRYTDKPLALFREGSHGGEIIYAFDENAYNSCVKKERTASIKQKKIQAANAKVNLHKKGK